MAKFNSKVVFTMARELNELHQIGMEMIKHVGQCEFISWRYPDQPIKDIAIDINAEFYNTQEKYILLIELIIDRLYLIMNMAIVILNNFTDLNNKKLFELPKNISRPPGISLGTVLAMFWRRLETLSSVLTLRSKEPNFKNNSKVSVGDIFATRVSLLTTTDKPVIPKSCENCSVSLSLIKSLINTVMNCMVKMKMESKTVVYKKNIRKAILKSDQSAVLTEWNEALISDINILTQNCVNISAENAFISGDLNEQKDENEGNLKQIKILHKKYNNLEKHNETLESHTKTVSENCHELQLKNNAVFSDLKRSEQISAQRGEALKNLEETYRTAMKSYGETLMSMQKAASEKEEAFESEKAYWKNLFNENKSQIEELTNNIAAQQEGHEIKLKEHAEKFHKQRVELEEKNVQLQTQKKTLSDQIYNLEMQEYAYKEKINHLEERKKKLKHDIKNLKEKETILIRCPDLNGPIISQDTQNPLEDMKDQITANELRMELLRDQTHNLKKVVNKMQNLTNNNQ